MFWLAVVLAVVAVELLALVLLLAWAEEDDTQS